MRTWEVIEKNRGLAYKDNEVRIKRTYIGVAQNVGEKIVGDFEQESVEVVQCRENGTLLVGLRPSDSLDSHSIKNYNKSKKQTGRMWSISRMFKLPPQTTFGEWQDGVFVFEVKTK